MITRGALVSEGPFNSHDYSESLFELNIDDSKEKIIGFLEEVVFSCAVLLIIVPCCVGW